MCIIHIKTSRKSLKVFIGKVRYGKISSLFIAICFNGTTKVGSVSVVRLPHRYLNITIQLFLAELL